MSSFTIRKSASVTLFERAGSLSRTSSSRMAPSLRRPDPRSAAASLPCSLFTLDKQDLAGSTRKRRFRKTTPARGSAKRHDPDGRAVREEEHPSPVLQGMRHPGAPIIPSGARRRWAMVAGVVLALAAFLAWRQSAPRAPAGAATPPAPPPAERATPPPAPRSQLPAPA